jgi:hypothetical protein
MDSTRLPDKNAGLLLVPSSRGGVDAISRKYRRRHPLIGADGVVRNISDHPACASEVASQLFLIAQPPLLWRRGIAAACRFFRLGNAGFSPRSCPPTIF